MPRLQYSVVLQESLSIGSGIAKLKTFLWDQREDLKRLRSQEQYSEEARHSVRRRFKNTSCTEKWNTRSSSAKLFLLKLSPEEGHGPEPSHESY